MQVKSADEIGYMNYLKFFGIVFLLIWHTGINGLNTFVILFFLQMFFFISGYFYKDSYSERPLYFFKKRFFSLYLPFVFYCSLFLLLNNLFVRWHFYSENMLIPRDRLVFLLGKVLTLDSRSQLAGAMWFVSCLLIASTIFCLIGFLCVNVSRRRRRDTNCEPVRFFIISMLYLMGNLFSVTQVTLPVLIDVSFVFLLFYYAGYLYRKHESNIPLTILPALVALFTLLVCRRFGIPMAVDRKYVGPAFMLVCGLAGIYLNVYLAKRVAAFGQAGFVSYVGKNTMVILALHLAAFKLISLVLICCAGYPLSSLAAFPVIMTSSQPVRWLYAAAGLFVPLTLKYVFDRGRQWIAAPSLPAS